MTGIPNPGPDALELVGWVQVRNGSESLALSGPPLDLDFIKAHAKVQEEAGFDRVLVGYFGTAPDGFLVASVIAHATTRLGLLLAHRPGFVAPTLAARKMATLDIISGGRLAVHVISGGDSVEQARDGDYLDAEGRYARSTEYMQIVRRMLAEPKPFDHAGTYYRFDGGFSEVKPVNGSIPIWFGGSSEAAIQAAGAICDTYAFWGEPVAAARDTVARVQAAARAHGRSLRFSLSTRPIIAETEERAWEKARGIIADIRRLRGDAPPPRPQNVGSQRLLEAAARGPVVDERLWTEVAAATGAKGNSTALVGTAEQVADSLMKYWDVGIRTFLMRGFDPIPDAADYGRHLLPVIRDKVRARHLARAS
ncbi:LLM class flavin-dependent oxidoreductase [Zavarzinia sp. CC-PAN008]|uniref:LLM class flavin-dependent oxidoreductase n=1 Tax=Zavarzinia sp. CC-PAN008 TaxID=3243332 RepID=UPI003F74319A